MKILILSVVLITSVSFCAKLPPNFKKCDRKQNDFLECLPLALVHAMRQMNKPIRELGLPSLDPLEVPSLIIQAGNRAVGLTQNFKDVKIYGINKGNCSKMGVDFKRMTIEYECTTPSIRLVTNYNITGKILLFDIKGSGLGVITLENAHVLVKQKLEQYEKNGKEHLKCVDIDLKLKPERVRFMFENLFNGDKILSDNVHQVINDNWKVVYDDVRSSYDEAFGQITRGIFNSVFARVSASDLFGEE